MSAKKELKLFDESEVGLHNSAKDLWVIIDGVVYDLSRFADLHPGGLFPLLEVAGKDATDAFYGLHRQDVLERYDRYQIGFIAGYQLQIELRDMGAVSKVPYAEPNAWQGFKSPYYT
jgi:predicted heme/steroid binding protein